MGKKDRPFSLSAYIEQLALLLRKESAAQSIDRSKAKPGRQPPLSHFNAIEQIARILRTEARRAKKLIRKKKKTTSGRKLKQRKGPLTIKKLQKVH